MSYKSHAYGEGESHNGIVPTKRRDWIPKADGRQRPLKIAALEDKIAQAAVVRVLNQIYGKRTFWIFRTGSGRAASSMMR